MVTQNHFVTPATVLEKFRSRGIPEGVTLNADHCRVQKYQKLLVCIDTSEKLQKKLRSKFLCGPKFTLRPLRLVNEECQALISPH